MVRKAISIGIAATLILASASVAAADDPALARAQRLAKQGIVFDGHNDLPWAIRNYAPAPMSLDAYDIQTHAPEAGQTDIPRLRAGGVGAQFWSVYIPGEAAGGFARTLALRASACWLSSGC